MNATSFSMPSVLVLDDEPINLDALPRFMNQPTAG